MARAKLKISVLISGRGSNLQALIDACRDPGFPASVVLVVSNVATAKGLERAAAAGIPAAVIEHRAYPDRESFEKELDAVLRRAGVELICLAGFMRLLTAGFVDAWRDRIVNIHPSLLPAFRGLHPHERALAAGVTITGCTVHFVRAEMDDGPIIVQAAVPVLPGDDADRLAARVLEKEHAIYPLALRLIAEGRLRIEGERVLTEGTAPSADALVNPGAGRDAARTSISRR